MNNRASNRRVTLRATQAALKVLQVLVLTGAGLFAIILIVTLISGPDLLTELSGEREIGNPLGALVAFEVALALAIVAAAALWLIVTRLLRIINAVQSGDAFAAENATHVRFIGSGLGAFVLAYIASKAVVQSQVPSARGVDWLAISPAVGAILMMFVLAEVFREGARMREDLEGVV